MIYTPYLSHPDPKVERRTGFLIPTYGSNSDLGQFVSTLYYINLAPNMDVTVTPIVTTGEGVVGAELRHCLQNTVCAIDGSLTYATKNSIEGDTTRGHIRSNLLHEFDPARRAGRKSLSTDDTYLRRYEIESTDTLAPFH